MARWPKRHVVASTAVAVTGVGALVAVTFLGGSPDTVHRSSSGAIPGASAGPAAGAAPAAATAHAPRTPAATPAPSDIDVRRPDSPEAQRHAEQRSAQLKARPAVRRLVHSLGPQGIVDLDPLTGTPRQVARLDGLLTPGSRARASAIALGYVRAHAAAFGLDAADLDSLHLARDYVDIAGTHHLSYPQSSGGVTLFGNGLKANVTRSGRLVNLTGSPVHHLAGGLSRAGTAAPRLDADAAVRTAKRSAGETGSGHGPDDTVGRVLFLTPHGLRPAWQVVAMDAVNPALSVVDAETGAILYRDLLGSDLASASAPSPYTATVWTSYPQPAPAGPGGLANTVTLTVNGWLAPGAQALSGNNVHAFTDIDGSDTVSATEEVKPTGAGGYGFVVHPTSVTGSDCTHTLCTWVPATPYSWQANSNAARTAVQNFYFINTWHDYLQAAPIGFTEAAGNFQKVNSSGQGKGGDAVLDEALSGAAVAAGTPATGFTNNADFATPPDGQAPTMRMFLFKPVTGAPFLPVAGSDTADVVYHEYTHGLSHRLLVDATGNPALDSNQGASMGEAWSDWYGLDYLVNHSATTGLTDVPGTPDVIEGRYLLGPNDATGIRSMPMDCPVGSSDPACTGLLTTGTGGYTYGDLRAIWTRTQGDVHAAGEIWAQTLWDLRSTMIASYGQGPGTARVESLVTRALELSPTYPSMLDMRNAILAADQADYAGGDVGALWTVFASRGMGFFASSRGGDDVQPVEDFTPPPAPGGPNGTVSGTVINTNGGGPLEGITVAVSGHDSGFPGDYVATTDAAGRYSMAGLVPGTYPSFYLAGGVISQPHPLTVAAGPNTQNWTVARNWAATSGGAKLGEFSGTDLTSAGCGPGAAVDQSQTTGWASDLVSGAPFLILKLPAAVDVSTFSIDPTNVCGDGRASALRDYRVDTSVDGVTWVDGVAGGSFTNTNMGKLNVVNAGGSPSRVRWVRLVLVSPQVPGQTFIDVTELEVFGPQSSTPPRPDHQGGGGGTVLGGAGPLPPLPR